VVKTALLSGLRAVRARVLQPMVSSQGAVVMRRVGGAVARWCAIAALASPLWAAAAPMLWFADDARLHQADASTRTLLRSLSVPVQALSADSAGGTWAATSSQVLRIDGSGVMRAAVNLSTLGLVAPVRVAADPRDGTAWVLGDRKLIHIGLAGDVLASTAVSTDDHAVAIAVSLDQRVWALSKKSLVTVSPAGVVVSQVNVGGALGGPATSLAVDPIGAVAWVAHENLNQNGQVVSRNLVRIDYSGASPTTTPTYSSSVNAVAVDGPTGALWALPDGSLQRYSPTGELQQTINLGALNLGTPRRLAIEPSGNALWLAHDNGVSAVTPTGAVAGSIVTGSVVRHVSASPFLPVPTLSLIAPPAELITNNPTPSFTLGYGTDCYGTPCAIAQGRLAAYTLHATLDTTPIGALFVFDPNTNRASYSVSTPLGQGQHQFSAYVRDSFGQTSNTVASVITVDTVAPKFLNLAPANDSRFAQPAITVTGSIDEPGTIQLGGAAMPGPTFSFPRALDPGTNSLLLSAFDQAGNSTQATLSYHYLTVNVSAPADGASVSTASVEVNGSFAGPADTTVTVNGNAASVSGGTFSATVPLTVGANVLTINATSAGVTATKTINVTRTGSSGGGGTLTAPPVDPTVASVLAETTSFLYSGANPVQTGVVPGTIEPKRVAVVRGKIISRDGEPIVGVRVTIKDHPELGQTLSRSDGAYDLAVNGGGLLVVSFEKAGYLPVQRHAKSMWQEFLVLEDVVMVALDPAVTTIGFSGATAMQVARGSTVTDGDGTRRATVLFPQGTTAQLVMPDGSMQALSTGSFRATEYTVGPNGPKAMPAPLPPTSGYTYAVELSFDEATSASAKSVRFNQPVPVYVENFLNFPVGGIVPLGYFDREKSAWVASDNGRVIRIVSVSAGAADIDADGDGAADADAALTSLGITSQERASLATLYSAGQSLWRVQVTHFTSFDHNWPFGPPSGAKKPTFGKYGPEPCDKPDCEGGSIIEAQNRTLGERVPLAGTPFGLNYRSDRVPGFKGNELNVRLSGDTLPPGVQRIDLRISIAGKVFTQSFPPQTNLSHQFVWDGMDAYGRLLKGAQRATISIGYVYRGTYRPPGEQGKAFSALPTSIQQLVDATARDITLWEESIVNLGSPDARALGLGGWTIDPHHSYDPTLMQLTMGDGGRRTITAVDSRVVSIVAGVNGPAYAGNRAPYSGDGGLATKSGIGASSGVAIDAKGTIYIASHDDRRILTVGQDGVLRTFAENGNSGYTGEGGPATAAAIGNPWAVAVAPDGAVFTSAPEPTACSA
jgi:hypothetical protein